MEVYVNNKLHEMQGTPNLSDVLDVLNIQSQKGIALAVNNNVISRADWPTHQLNPNDKITLIKATQGG